MAEEPNLDARLFRISGRVQGVFYRRSAQLEAERLALTGWVRNTQDGQVEAYACGPANRLDEFERWLAHGPRNARVSAVAAVPAAPERMASFEIR